jgi:molybdate transport system substrate-binding protein
VKKTRTWFLPVVVALAMGGSASDVMASAPPTSDPPAQSDVTVTETSAVPVDGDVTVFAAASLTDAFTEIGEAFIAVNPEADVTFNFASSSDLVNQINEGAPADVFASADQANMTKLVDEDGADGEPATFATNTLEIIVEAGNPQRITGLEDLADRSDLIVVSCAPEVPIGAYTEEVFQNAGVEVELDSLEENVRAVVEKVVSGEADAGVVYATDVTAAGDDAEGVEIPSDVNVVAEYPIAVAAEAPNPEAATAFQSFVLGQDGHEILAGYGFGAP